MSVAEIGPTEKVNEPAAIQSDADWRAKADITTLYVRTRIYIYMIRSISMLGLVFVYGDRNTISFDRMSCRRIGIVHHMHVLSGFSLFICNIRFIACNLLFKFVNGNIYIHFE